MKKVKCTSFGFEGGFLIDIRLWYTFLLLLYACACETCAALVILLVGYVHVVDRFG